MKKILVVSLILLSMGFQSVFAMELQSLTVETNYWFGKANSPLVGPENNFAWLHNSTNIDFTGKFSPGFILGADYTSGKLASPSLDGHEIMLSEHSAQQQLLSIYAGYPYQVTLSFQLTVSAGLDYFVKTDKMHSPVSPQEKQVWSTKMKTPSLGLAAQYQVSPNFLLKGNLTSSLGSEGTFTFLFNEISNVPINVLRWQLEGKYLFKPGWEATFGYRVWDISASHAMLAMFGGQPYIHGSKGLYLGARTNF